MKTIIAVIILSIVTAIAANAQTVNVNSLYEGPYDIQGFVAWKKYLEERKKTQKGAPLSPLDNQAVQPAVTAPPPMDAKARYDAFLRSKGVDPNTIGAATVVNGRMVVPTIEEQYAARNLSWRWAVPAGSIEAQRARGQRVNLVRIGFTPPDESQLSPGGRNRKASHERRPLETTEPDPNEDHDPPQGRR